MRFKNDEEMVAYYDRIRAKKNKEKRGAIWSLALLVASVPTFVVLLKVWGPAVG